MPLKAEDLDDTPGARAEFPEARRRRFGRSTARRRGLRRLRGAAAAGPSLRDAARSAALGAAAGDGGGLVGFCLDALARCGALDGGVKRGDGAEARGRRLVPPRGPRRRPAAGPAPRARRRRWALLVAPADAPGGDSKKRKLTPETTAFGGLGGLSSTDGGAVDADAAAVARACGDGGADAAQAAAALRIRALKGLKRLLEDDKSTLLCGILFCWKADAVWERCASAAKPWRSRAADFGAAKTRRGAGRADAAAADRDASARAAAAEKLRDEAGDRSGLSKFARQMLALSSSAASQAATQAASPADDDAAAFGAAPTSPSQDLAARVDASLALDDDGDEYDSDDDLVVAPDCGDTSIDLNPVNRHPAMAPLVEAFLRALDLDAREAAQTPKGDDDDVARAPQRAESRGRVGELARRTGLSLLWSVMVVHPRDDALERHGAVADAVFSCLEETSRDVYKAAASVLAFGVEGGSRAFADRVRGEAARLSEARNKGSTNSLYGPFAALVARCCERNDTWLTRSLANKALRCLKDIIRESRAARARPASCSSRARVPAAEMPDRDVLKALEFSSRSSSASRRGSGPSSTAWRASGPPSSS
ncbi:hypothetical protein SO694_00083062 [Aureococcus anophagefferens]|uniref:CLASP N-terminal domain-containing protein n=1 Tax=Aureococcus anophagefferens TaxID=44056 RepID=A0ABR1FJ93_AURAN